MPVTRTTRVLPLRPDIHEIRVTSMTQQQDDAGISREKIADDVQKLAARYPNKQFQVLLPYESWKSGAWFTSRSSKLSPLFSLEDYYDESQLPEDSDPDYFDEYIIYVRDNASYTGGCNKDNSFNDCLYKCLLFAYGTRSRLPESIKTPELLKEGLGLCRSDPIPIKFIPAIELLAGTIAINVTGDHKYQSKQKSKRQITLILANGHYSISRNPDRKRLKIWASHNEKKPLIYRNNGVKNIVNCYDGTLEKYWDITTRELRRLKSESWSGQWCFVKVSRKKNGIFESFKEAFTRFNLERDDLLEKSKQMGLPIDLQKCGGSYKIAALWTFEQLSRAVPANEPLDPLEAEWLRNSMKGGLIWAENGWSGTAEQYDFTSMYPFLLTKYFFPIGKGNFRTVDDFMYNNRGIQMSYYGIFHAKVELREGMHSLFRYNSNDFYTHHDLNRAKSLGLNVTLYKDNSPNALIYESKKNCPGSIIFGSYVEMLFNIKKNGGPAGNAAKRILNTLWGALCEKKITYYDIGKGTKWTSENPFVISSHNEKEILHTVIPSGEGQWTVQCSNPENVFKGEYPRVAPFLLAAGRKLISETIAPYKDCLKRVHTDGFILKTSQSTPIIEVLDDANTILGKLKFERNGKCTVKNANQVIWIS